MALALIIVGVGVAVGGPIMMEGFDATINATNASTFTGLQSTAKAGPTLIILGIIIGVAVVGFLGIQIARKGKG